MSQQQSRVRVGECCLATAHCDRERSIDGSTKGKKIFGKHNFACNLDFQKTSRRVGGNGNGNSGSGNVRRSSVNGDGDNDNVDNENLVEVSVNERYNDDDDD
jgi:hypothetical protein